MFRNTIIEKNENESKNSGPCSNKDCVCFAIQIKEVDPPGSMAVWGFNFRAVSWEVTDTIGKATDIGRRDMAWNIQLF